MLQYVVETSPREKNLMYILAMACKNVHTGHGKFEVIVLMPLELPKSVPSLPSGQSPPSVDWDVLGPRRQNWGKNVSQLPSKVPQSPLVLWLKM